MSFERKGDTYRWTYCDKCSCVNGDAYGQVILCACDRKEVARSIERINKNLKDKGVKLTPAVRFEVVEKAKKKVRKKKKTANVDILKYKNDYEAGY